VVTWSLKSPFRPSGEKGWIADLPPALHLLTDGNEDPLRSALQLLEGERPLGPAHSLHQTIQTEGRGAFSFWGPVLYFSTSDGSDPNRNRREYRVVHEPGEPLLQSADPGSTAWVIPERPLRCAIFGAGNRGVRLGELAYAHPGVEIAWTIDQSEDRAREASWLFRSGPRAATDIALAVRDPAVDIVFVAVPDHLHRACAVPAFDAGKHVFIEKPLATTAEDGDAILAAWRRSGRILQLGYVLRHTRFYSGIRSVVQCGALGPIRVANLSEQLSVLHGASFMRRWHARSDNSGGLLVHKACHDLDILCWILDARPLSVSSFGGLDTFHAVPPARFCSRCDRRQTCPYIDKGLFERRTAAERADPTAFGLDRCVYRTDKDIVDNQVVAYVLDNGTRGTFTLSMQAPHRSERRIVLIGDHGRLEGVFEDGRYAITFTDSARTPFVWQRPAGRAGGHGGGDRAAMTHFLRACAGMSPPPISTREDAMRGLLFALAAEQARKREAVVRLEDTDFAEAPVLARVPVRGRAAPGEGH
jgi:predicted dehydrogenase